MKRYRIFNIFVMALVTLSMLVGSTGLVAAVDPPPPPPKKERITHADREAAAQRAADAGFELMQMGEGTMAPGEAPHYFSVPNYANSPLPYNAVVQWNLIAQDIVQPMPMDGMPMTHTSMSAAFVYLSYVHAAIYDALASIEGGYAAYNFIPGVHPDASRDAAIAAAAYTVLKTFFPSAMLDHHYQAALAMIPDGQIKTDGIAVGTQAAQAILAQRAGDMLMGDGGYTIPDPAPGVWQPTALLADGVTPAPPIDPWMRVLQPFTLTSPDQFRPPAPPALDDAAYLADLAEVTAVGSATSATRLPEQTAIAQFWGANMVVQTETAYRDIATKHNLNLIDTARLMAMGNMIGTDALIACFDSKYTYSFWRPVTAINYTSPELDPDWMPLMNTPNHPEYVAGHGCFMSSQAEVYTHVLGTSDIALDLTSTATNNSRHFATAQDLRNEIVNARVWGGMHFRNSVLLGVGLGKLVADYAIANFFGPDLELSPHLQYSGGVRKFVNELPGLGPGAANNLGQYIPLAKSDVVSYPGSDYYEIALVEYEEQMHSDLPPTRLRGYVQLETADNAATSEHWPLPGGYWGYTKPHYLGPTIVATKDRPVRILFRNLLPTGAAGNLFIPVDTTVMGSGMGAEMAGMAEPDPQNPMCGMEPKPYECYTENRATLHLHGGISPWISDGTPHQWITPANENTPYPQGVSVVNVPDMNACNDPRDGCQTFYYTNQQSARLMFYHDHAWGITRLNVYAGEAAGYIITDSTEQALLNANIIPAEQIPLIIQDKTFVPGEAQLAITDPTWDMARWGTPGDLWLPHVYVPAQNPGDASGVNEFGRWAYGPWFWPPTNSVDYGPIANPYYDPACDPNVQWCEPPLMPGTPFNSMGMEAFHDTPVVNGTAYPTLELEPKAYRFRILNAANDRFFNLSLYEADASGTEVALNPDEVLAALNDPFVVFPTPVAPPGPNWIQIGSESGFLPAPVEIPAQPTTWVNDPTVFNAGNVDQHSLLLGPAERADVIVDFSAFAGKTLILYNDAPAAFPARDPRYDYYTGNADLRDTGGTPPTLPGYGPNTRTVMQITIKAVAPAPAFDKNALTNAFKATSLGGQGVFANGQHPIIVGQQAYNSAYGTNFSINDGLVQIYDTSLAVKTLTGATLTFPLQPKQIQDEMGEAFDHLYGRMSGNLGVETPGTQAGIQNMILYGFTSPPTEVLDGVELPPGVELAPIATTDDGTQIWKITHNGVDTHPIHFHLYDVQLINRVGWDGIIRKPEASELGWKDTVRISPLEDTIVALRPLIPQVPFDLPNSVRLLDPSMPEGAVLASATQALLDGTPIFSFDPNGEPIDIINHYVNFGWEYVIHCHILSHEEMDMMRPVVVGVAPKGPTELAISVKGSSATLTWKDNSLNETSFVLQRSNDASFISGLTVFRLAPNTTTYVDNTIKKNTTYYYRVFAENLIGDTWDYTDPELNEGASFPTKAIVSAFSNTVMLGTVPPPPAAPTNLTATVQAGPQVRLAWQDNANNETGFVIERSTDGINFSTLATLGTNITSYTDTAVTPGSSYVYRVKAVNAGGDSAYSNTASVTIPATPAAPTNLSGTTFRQGGNARVTLTWKDNATNESGFTLQRATNLNFTAGLNSTNIGANLQTYTTGNLPRNTTFYFRIRAYNSAGTSAWSNIFIITTAP
ncbi:MAG: multicopper oxidase domain-containing protein [Anaerolineaceae bacterium]|jgi:FtsP/CotA-like multicopper oxidase with cupredoxin domain